MIDDTSGFCRNLATQRQCQQSTGERWKTTIFSILLHISSLNICHIIGGIKGGIFSFLFFFFKYHVLYRSKDIIFTHLHNMRNHQGRRRGVGWGRAERRGRNLPGGQLSSILVWLWVTLNLPGGQLSSFLVWLWVTLNLTGGQLSCFLFFFLGNHLK